MDKINEVLDNIARPISGLAEWLLRIGLGISFIAILLSGTSSFVCDIDEKILKQIMKVKNFIILRFKNIK